jgi:hypothetical protein
MEAILLLSNLQTRLLPSVDEESHSGPNIIHVLLLESGWWDGQGVSEGQTAGGKEVDDHRCRAGPLRGSALLISVEVRYVTSIRG